MAYLYKHTPLQTTFPVNLTCLVPTENPLVGKPERLELHAILWQFLHFRLEVVRSRLKHELEALKTRMHILEGFETIFDALDEILKIVRKSDGKADAAQKIIARFGLDADQTDAILELKIYRLARLEILVIRQELEEKRKRAKEIGGLLKRDADLWKIVRSEIEHVHKTYGDARRTEMTGEVPDEEYTADDFIIEEDNVVIVTHDGWVKRQKEVKDIASTRLREGDSVLAVMPGSTRATAVFFSNFGTAYTARLVDLPASTGYGEPVQSLFKLKDAARRSSVRRTTSTRESQATIKAATEADPVSAPIHAVAVTSDGYSLRFSLSRSRSSRGEHASRPQVRADGARRRRWSACSASPAEPRSSSRPLAKPEAILCKAKEVNFLSGPGRGVILIKLQKEDDRLLGFIASTGDRDLLTVETTRGAAQTISTTKYEVTGRGGKGRELLQRGEFVRVVPVTPETPAE